MNLEKQDVEMIGGMKGVILTDKQTECIIRQYQSAQLEDPGATWDLVIDDLIDRVLEMTEDELDFELSL